MISGMRTVKESVDLLKLKTDRLVESREGGYYLKEDVWERGTLVLRSGAYLTEEIINKLLKFGVKRVNVDYDDPYAEDSSFGSEDELMKQFIAGQSVLIVDKNLINSSNLVRQLVDTGFSAGNIFVTKEPTSINQYFRAKKINFLFVDDELYDVSAKCIEKYSLLRNTHAFIMLSSTDLRKFRKAGVSKIKFLLKPVMEEKLKPLLRYALDQNFLDFWAEDEALIS